MRCIGFRGRKKKEWRHFAGSRDFVVFRENAIHLSRLRSRGGGGSHFELTFVLRKTWEEWGKYFTGKDKMNEDKVKRKKTKRSQKKRKKRGAGGGREGLREMEKNKRENLLSLGNAPRVCKREEKKKKEEGGSNAHVQSVSESSYIIAIGKSQPTFRMHLPISLFICIFIYTRIWRTEVWWTVCISHRTKRDKKSYRKHFSV